MLKSLILTSLISLNFLGFTPAARSADGVPVALDRVVFITDSHGVGRFGEEAAHWLRQRPATEFDFFASGASAPLQWLNNAFNTPCGFSDSSHIPLPEPRACKKLHTPTLASLWKAHGPKTSDERRISIIALGTNYGMQPSWNSEQVSQTAKLIQEAVNLSDRCIWIGPPTMTRAPGFEPASLEVKYKIIQDAIALAAQKTGKPPCELIDSRPLSHYPKKGGDGIHYHWPGSKVPESIRTAEEWADAVTGQIESLLARP